jgi:hypothetical protein
MSKQLFWLKQQQKKKVDDRKVSTFVSRSGMQNCLRHDVMFLFNFLNIENI